MASAVSALAFTKDGTLMIGMRDGAMCLWPLGEARPRQIDAGPGSSVAVLAASPAGVLAGYDNGFVSCFTAPTATELRPADRFRVLDITILREKEVAVLLSRDTGSYRLETHGSVAPWCLEFNEKRLDLPVAIASLKDDLILGSASGALWHGSERRREIAWDGFRGWGVTKLCPTRFGTLVGGYLVPLLLPTDTTRLYQVIDPIPAECNHLIQSMAVAGEGAWILAGYRDGAVLLWRLQSGAAETKPSWQLDRVVVGGGFDFAARAVAINSDGTQLAFARGNEVRAEPVVPLQGP